MPTSLERYGLQVVDHSPASPRPRPAARRSADLHVSAAGAIRVVGGSAVLLGYLAGYWLCLRWIVHWLLRA